MNSIKPLIAMDEAGNTGQDLLNEDQPAFTLASVLFSDKEISKLVSLLKSKHASEVHFSDLKKSSSGRKKIMSFLNDRLISKKTVKLSVYHKKYMIIAKALDSLVEPIFYKEGVNFYEKGMNLGLTNLHFYLMPTFCGSDPTARFFANFVSMIRKKDQNSINAFFDSLRELKKCSTNIEYVEQFDLILASESIIDELLEDVDKSSIDPALPSFIDHIAAWGDSLDTEFDVIHDASKIIAYQLDLIRKVLYKEIDPISVGYGIRTRRFPLLADDIKLVNSKKYPQIQLADILAGSLAYWANGILGKKVNSEFFEELKKSPLEELLINSVWPSEKFTPKELGMVKEGGIDPIDFVANLLAQQRKNND